MIDDRVTFRFPGATLPLRGNALGKGWTLETYFVQGTGSWRAYLRADGDRERGSDGYFIDSAPDEARMGKHLTVRGVSVPRRSPVATVFRAFETQGLAEQIHSSSSNS
jgi:hypothetical protein